jgi:hypothetical protein
MRNSLALPFMALFLLQAAITQVAYAQEDSRTDSSNTLESLIQNLPSQFALKQAKGVIRNKASFKESVKAAKDTIEKAKEVVPQLRKVIKKGKSVFEYPGLIAKGSIRYRMHSREYRIYFGFCSVAEGIGATDFNVILNDKGIITSIENVDWLH